MERPLFYPSCQCPLFPERRRAGTWTLEFDENAIFKRTIDDSLYLIYQKGSADSHNDLRVLEEDDKAMFQRYYRIAIGDLKVALARRMDDPGTGVDDDGEGRTYFFLSVTNNHEELMIQPLHTHCVEYLIKAILQMFYNRHFGKDTEMDEIKHCIHFRRGPVRRKIRPLL